MATQAGVARDSGERGRSALAELFPGYFALVMATGIIAIASFQQGVTWLAWVLLWAGVAFSAVLWVLYVVRLARYRRAFVDDLTGHQRGPAFLTMVAGTNVLGAGFVVIAGWRPVGLALWWVGLALWTVLFYTVLASITLRGRKPDIATGLNGGWLVLVVGTESVGVLAALLAAGAGRPDVWEFAALVACMTGLMLYLIIIGLVCYRWWFFPMASGQATPTYWINMGAVAITTLACANIAINGHAVPGIDAIEPFLGGMTVMFWAAATWWIPLLVIVGIWRHVVQRVPLRYDPQYWSLVFPLGMYGVATFRMEQALGITFLDWLPTAFFWIALGAWAVTLVGMARSVFLRPAG